MSKNICYVYNFVKWKKTVSQEEGLIDSTVIEQESARFGGTENTPRVARPQGEGRGGAGPGEEPGSPCQFPKHPLSLGRGPGVPMHASPIGSSFGCNKEKVRQCTRELTEKPRGYSG